MPLSELKSGTWVKFTIPDRPVLLVPRDEDPQKPSNKNLPMLVKGTIDDPDEAAVLMKRMHRAGEMFVGIYTRASVDPVTRKPVPANITPVEKDKGTNLRFIHNGIATLVTFDPDSLSGVVELMDVADIPKDRVLQKGWIPQAARRAQFMQQPPEQSQNQKPGKKKKK